MILKKAESVKLVMTGLILFVVILSGCTKKNNLTGNNWSDVSPLIANDTTFVMGYSYTHSGKVTGSEKRLMIGNQDGIQAAAVIRFTGMADTMIVSGEPILSIVASRRSALRRDPLTLSFFKLNKDWSTDSTALISDADMTPLNMPAFPIPDSVYTGGDTLQIPVPVDILEDWYDEDVTGFNIVIKAVGDGWVEIKSLDSGYGPKLDYTFRETGDTSDNTYSQRVYKDSYRISGTQNDITDDVWKLKNLLPQRMVMQFGLPNGIFKDSDGNPLTAADLKRMTVNKAEVVLFVKNNPYYDDVSCSFYPYSLGDTLSMPRVLLDDDLENNSYTVSTSTIVNADSVRINITAIVHAYTSQSKPNNGIVIKCLQEMQNYGNLEFWHYSDAPAGKKPYIKITYTPPYLKGR